MNVMATNQTTVETIIFGDLVLSTMNPRTVVSEDSIIALAANIAKVGLIQNLAGYRQGNGETEVVAGGRRLRALALLQDDPRFQTVTVNVTSDEAVAKLWATSENSQREALHPADEIRDFGAMAKRGLNVADIALAYGCTEKHVYRRLALANLPNTILDGLKEGTVSLAAAAAFTISNDERLTLEVFQQYLDRAEQGYGSMSEAKIKHALKPNTVTDTDRRAIFVTVETYKAAGGHVSSDLFAETSILDDMDILDSLFAEKLELEAGRMNSVHGGMWAETYPDTYLPYDYIDGKQFGRVYRVEGELTDAEQERYEELDDMRYGDGQDDDAKVEYTALATILKGEFSAEQKVHTGIVVLVNRDGQIEITEGLIRKVDQPEAIEAGILAKSRHEDTTTDTPKSPISAKLGTDLDRIVTGSRQNALLDDPKLALHLLAFQMSGKMSYRRAYGLRLDDVRNAPETLTGFDLDTRLTQTDDRDWDSNDAAEFAKFRKRGDAKIMDLLNRLLVAQLQVDDGDLGAALDKLTKKVTRDSFTPNAENFFKRVGGPYLVALWTDLLGLADDHPTVTTFAELKKGEKADKLEQLFAVADVRDALGVTAAQSKRIATWLPEDMV